MSLIIVDGTGKGRTAKVDSENRLHVNAINLTEPDFAVVSGKSFTVTTSRITLTSDSPSTIAFLQNTGIEDVITDSFTVNFGISTGGAGLATLGVTRNPTGGTITVTPTVMVPFNRNFGSASILSMNLYEGVEGDTGTGGDSIGDILLGAPTFLAVADKNVLITGNSLSVTVTPPPGNTSMVVILSANVHTDGFGE